MSEVLLSAFNPSTMSPQLLEAIFVEREPLVQELLSGIRGSLSPTSKAHALVLGPRGMGKTHLVSLIYHRIREGREGAEGLDEHLRVAWLREEERGIATFFHLLRRILIVLADTYSDPELKKRLAELSGHSLRDAQPLAERLLVEWLGDKTLLLLVENFEDMLSRMGDVGQQQFRAFLQNRSCCIVLATAPTLTVELSRQTAPFYNFFNLHTLEEFSVETARALMKMIAEQRCDTALREFLDTPIATERLRAIEDLAGGHPRIWILFAGFLTRDILDALVPAFYKLMDDLTPYYQSRMELLPGQEALIVETLCEKPGAIPVKELAEACFLAQNAVSAHLNDLAKRGYVRSEKLGRESYYELREPLLRMWLQVKGERDKPLRLIVEFIKRWFKVTEIIEKKKNFTPDSVDYVYMDESLSMIVREVDDHGRLLVEISDLLKGGDSVGLYGELIPRVDMIYRNRNINTEINDLVRPLIGKEKFMFIGLESRILIGVLEKILLLGTSVINIAVLDVLLDMVNLSARFGRVVLWGQGLVESIHLLSKTEFTNENADAWLSAWQQAGVGYEELEIPLRMLAAAVEWKKTRSRAALLRLEPELRSKLESLLPPEASVVEAKKGKKGKALQST